MKEIYMPPLYIFKESFIQNLRLLVQANLKNYENDNVWANRIGLSSGRDLPTSVNISPFPELTLPANNDLKDAENAIQLHKSLPNLTLLQARDPRLWTRLCHVEFWSYMRNRWPIERYLKNGEKKAAGRILERYFIPQSQSRSLIRNGIARLWWSAHLSFSPARENPYELTQVLMSTLDITQSILERSIGRAPNIVHGFLEFLLRHKDELLTGGNINRLKIRKLTKYLNMYGGVSILDYLSEFQIIGLLENEYKNLGQQVR
jgi:hypothetical protein